MKIVFMGTPEFAAVILGELVKKHNVTAVFAQPDRPKDRGGKVQKPPVKELAESLGIPVFQPEKIKSPEACAVLKNFGADIFVVAAYGQILSKEILEMPPFGCINIHASLLPKFRGAAPIQWAIARGEEKTGVTIMKMDEGLDTGDMLCMSEIEIMPEDTGGSLTKSLAELGAETLDHCLDNLLELHGEKQNDTLAGSAPILKKEMGRVIWNEKARDIVNKIRAFDPFPSAFTDLNGHLIKIWRAIDVSERFADSSAIAGTIIQVDKNGGFVVKTGQNGAVLVTEAQAAGKKRMSASDFLRGFNLNTGDVFGKGDS